MSKIVMNNGLELETISNNGFVKEYQNAKRQCMEFVFDKSSYEAGYLYDTFLNESLTQTVTITETNAEGIESSYIHSDYVINVSVSVYKQETIPETVEDPAEYADRISVTMAQRSYSEKMQENMRQEIDDILIALVEGGA